MRRNAFMSTPRLPDTSVTIMVRSSVDSNICGWRWAITCTACQCLAEHWQLCRLSGRVIMLTWRGSHCTGIWGAVTGAVCQSDVIDSERYYSRLNSG